ncbi:MAG: FtsW/RodA/SpoVE family cell cycle protein [Acidimicrobiia bacterium]|nr:FtsW/RodA/SpoVE family cell cycle protein [Acidimicrobiia bacterium]
MSRNAEAALLAAAAVIAAFGVTLVNLASARGMDTQVALTFLVFVLAFGGLHVAARQWAPAGSPFLLPLSALLTTIGFVEIYRLDTRLAGLQRWWIVIGATLAIVTLLALTRAGTDVIRRYRYIFLAIALLLLLLPLLPLDWGFPIRGRLVNGSRLWVAADFGFIDIQFQPGELVKVLLVGFLASYLAERQQALSMMTRRVGRFTVPEPRQVLPLAIAWTASFGVLVYQRDLGASLLLFTVFVAMVYAATGRAAYLVAGGGMFAVGAVTAWATFAHVQPRIQAWLSPFTYYETTGYQVANGLFAMGSGSLSGAGLGLGRPNLIPFAATDFIFAAVAEELGYPGSVVVLSLFGLLVAVGIGIALRSRDLFRKLLAAGLTFTLGLQAVLIVGGVVRLFPLTGITLPFMSYGGSSLVSNFVIVALLIRISHEERS